MTRKGATMTPPPLNPDPTAQLLVDAAWRVEQLCSTSLTERERDTVGLVCAGATTAQIAVALEISSATVKCYLHHVYRKTGLEGREAIVRHAFKLPTFQPPPAAASPQHNPWGYQARV